MLRELKRLVNPWLLARQSRELVGSVPVASMDRLLALLASPDGEVRFRFRFQPGDEVGGEEQAFADLHVATDLWLSCQRSLEPFEMSVAHDARLAFFASEADLALCPEDREPVLVERRQMPLLQLVEDEVILALPIVAVNPQAPPIEVDSGGTLTSEDDRGTSAEERADDDDEQEERNQPFANLDRLMRDS